jgi:predicted nucleic acid-binding protein
LVLLDTDIWSHLFSDARRRHPNDARWRELLLGRTIAIATQARAEVLAGAAMAQWGERRTLALRAQLDKTATVPVTSDVVEAYIQLTGDLKTSGHALQQKQHTGDRWVAATAIALGAPLFSADGIYRGAPGLVLFE